MQLKVAIEPPQPQGKTDNDKCPPSDSKSNEFVRDDPAALGWTDARTERRGGQLQMGGTRAHARGAMEGEGGHVDHTRGLHNLIRNSCGGA